MGIEVDGANQKLILDSDGDTYIEGATDDTLKVYVSGAQDFTITANTLTAESGSTIAAQALTATTVTASGIIKTDDATEATSTTDGSLQTDGGLSVVKDTVMGDDLKLLSDASVIHFGANSEITLTHSHDAGLNLKHTATADDKPVVLTLQTGETDIAANDVIGAINFQAPDEGTGTDAILVAAGIEAVSEGDFSSSSNATKLSFKTGASEAAAEKMSLSSAGLLTIADDLVIKDGGTIGVSSDADSITIASNGAVTFSQTPVFPDGSIAVADLDIDGATDIGAAIVDADLLIIDDGAGGTNRKTTAARLKTYMGDNTPRFYAYRNGTQSIANNTYTVIQFNAESSSDGSGQGYDSDSAFDSSTNYRFTPGVSGKYFLHANASTDNESSSNTHMTIRKNGSAIARNKVQNTHRNSIGVAITIDSDTDDYFDVEIMQDSGGGRNILSGYEYTWFTGFKLA
jgi:hypothetical protein